MVKDTSTSGRIYGAVVHIFVFVVLIATLYPILHIASVSLSEDVPVRGNQVKFFPIGLNFRAYQLLLTSPTIPNSFKNSVFYTVLGTLVNMVMTTTMAYALSKKRLAFRGFFTVIVVITFFFSGGLIPTFLLVKSLGMYNTVWALAIPGAIATWNLIILRTFFQTLSPDIEESAFIDGASDITVFFRIMLPISQAAVATIALFYAVGHWNSWFPAVIYLSKVKKYPLQVLLRQIVIMNQMTEALMARGEMMAAQAEFELRQAEEAIVIVDRIKYATLFISIIPMLVLYPFLQKYFIKGLMIGSIKG